MSQVSGAVIIIYYLNPIYSLGDPQQLEHWDKKKKGKKKAQKEFWDTDGVFWWFLPQ